MIKTIWQALAEKLGREPTNAEAVADVRRILGEAALENLKAPKRKHRSNRKAR